MGQETIRDHHEVMPDKHSKRSCCFSSFRWKVLPLCAGPGELGAFPLGFISTHVAEAQAALGEEGSCCNLLPVQAEQSDMGERMGPLPPAVALHDSHGTHTCVSMCMCVQARV